MQSILILVLLALASCTAPRLADTGGASSGFVAGASGVDAELGASFDTARSDMAPAGGPAPAEPAAPIAPGDGRQVVYSAALRLVVVSARDARASIVDIARQVGGHMQESDGRSVTVRVPAGEFDAVLTRIESLGEVVDSSVRAADVTEEMLDLGIRLDNARKARERLLAHLAQSDEIEDTLKIEAELTRVTEEIERIEGRLRYLESQIAMSTIRVELNTNQPQRAGDELDLPFAWVARLGDGLVAGTVKGESRQPGWFSGGPRFDPPPAFVRYYRANDLVEAMNAEGVRIKVRVHDNFDSGAATFWSQLARSVLVKRRSLAITEERALRQDRALIRGTREIGREASGYLLVLVRTKDHVHTFEAWGPKAAFDSVEAQLLRSAESLSP